MIIFFFFFIKMPKVYGNLLCISCFFFKFNFLSQYNMRHNVLKNSINNNFCIGYISKIVIWVWMGLSVFNLCVYLMLIWRWIWWIQIIILKDDCIWLNRPIQMMIHCYNYQIHYGEQHSFVDYHVQVHAPSTWKISTHQFEI